MKKFVIQVVLLMVIFAIALLVINNTVQVPELPLLPSTNATRNLRINDALFKVEIADTQAKRSKGLGGKESLASDEGMLFVFGKPDKYPFWMKGLNFSLDFIWIREDKVVDLTQNVSPPAVGQPDSSLTIYQPKEEVDKVLEVNGGTIQRLNIKVGDMVSLE